MSYRFKNWHVQISKKKYSNGRVAIVLIDEEDGLDLLTATVNLPYEDLQKGEAFIKNWGENEGVLEFLQSNNIVGPVKGNVPSGFVQAQIVDLYI